MAEDIERGALYGLLTTLGMTVIMLIGVGTGLSPMPAPIPIALAHWVLGNAPKPVPIISAAIAHFVYGGAAGAMLFAVLRDRVRVVWGLGYGVLLWIIM